MAEVPAGVSLLILIRACWRC